MFPEIAFRWTKWQVSDSGVTALTIPTLIGTESSSRDRASLTFSIGPQLTNHIVELAGLIERPDKAG